MLKSDRDKAGMLSYISQRLKDKLINYQKIKIQYKELNNTTNGDYSQYTPYHGCYSTVGIENHLGNIGLEYTFDNKYPNALTVDDVSILVSAEISSALNARLYIRASSITPSYNKLAPE